MDFKSQPILTFINKDTLLTGAIFFIGSHWLTFLSTLHQHYSYAPGYFCTMHYALLTCLQPLVRSCWSTTKERKKAMFWAKMNTNKLLTTTHRCLYAV